MKVKHIMGFLYSGLLCWPWNNIPIIKSKAKPFLNPYHKLPLKIWDFKLKGLKKKKKVYNFIGHWLSQNMPDLSS